MFSTEPMKGGYDRTKFTIGDSDEIAYKVSIVHDKKENRDLFFGNYTDFHKMDGTFEESRQTGKGKKPRYVKRSELYIGKEFDRKGLVVKPFMSASNQMVLMFTIERKE